ncbi:MAG: hypothetical protein NW241_11990 [Bacteroidia bacterium]|nr:hypothetical protein [Bacteroidia bacterium]
MFFKHRPALRSLIIPGISALALLISSCKPDGYINKVKYEGVKYVNTCEGVTAALNKLIAANNDPNRVKISEYDNSDFTYYYLEPGQFELRGDTLYFRLAQDLPYGQLLGQGVALHVIAGYTNPEALRDIDPETSNTLGTLVVNDAYYRANRKPFFLYKVPVSGKKAEGKQLTLAFAIAKYDKNGVLKEYFCQTDATPIGTAQPACCTAKPWEPVALQTVVDLPKLDLKPESYAYAGFTGTIEVMFRKGSFNTADDSAFSTQVIQSYVEKYKGMSYGISGLALSGYASPEGREALNLKLSNDRAQAVRDGLRILNGNLDGLAITSEGKGEDFERMKLLVLASTLTSEQKAQVILIIEDPALTADQKEAKMKALPVWNTIMSEVMTGIRRTSAVMDFAYRGKLPVLERYADRLPVASMQMEEVAKTVITAKPYQPGTNSARELATIDDILTKKANPNLYALRASYYAADKQYQKAIEDLEKAGRFRDNNSAQYSLAVQGYKMLFADAMELEQKKQLYREFTDLTQKNPADRVLFFNRALLMDKIGYTSGALAEYQQLFEGNAQTGAQLNNRGAARVKAHRFTEAQADFEAAVAKQPELAEAYFNLAAIAAWKGLTLKTIEYLDKAVALNPAYKTLIFSSPAFTVMRESSRFDKYR